MRTVYMKADRYQCRRGICSLHLQDWNESGLEGGRLYKLREKRNVTEWYWPFRTWDRRKGGEGQMPIGNWSWETPSSLGQGKWKGTHVSEGEVRRHTFFSKERETTNMLQQRKREDTFQWGKWEGKHVSVRKVRRQTCFTKESGKAKSILPKGHL